MDEAQQTGQTQKQVKCFSIKHIQAKSMIVKYTLKLHKNQMMKQIKK